MTLITRQLRARPFVDLLVGRKCSAVGFCSAADQNKTEELYYRAPSNDTRNHTLAHRGMFFTVDKKIEEAFGDELNPRTNLHAINYLGPRDWVHRCRVFGETNIMIRKPALEMIDYIQNTKPNQPAVRYVVYGKDGVGKSVTLAHLICYGYENDYVVMPFAWIKKWMTKYYEVSPSTYRPGRIDHVANANIFLKNFRMANADRLENCVTHKVYSWGSRDKTQCGAPLLEVINLGCERFAFAADAMNVVLKELKLNCNDGNCKMMVVLDGVNALFTEHTLVNKEDTFYKPRKFRDWQDWQKTVAKVEDCSVLRSIKKLLVNDYKNAVIITSVDRAAELRKTDPGHRWWKSQVEHMVPDSRSHLPFSLLAENGGWEMMNPFVPIQVDNYSEQELDASIDLHVEKRWIRGEAAERKLRSEIHFLTGRNPKDFFTFSAVY